MLSRTADHLFWMSRYMERAENTARMLDVNYQTSLLPQSADAAVKGWKGLLGISELSGDFAKRYDGAISARNVMQYMVADAQEVESFVLQHRAHRHAARQVRAELDPLEQRARVAVQVVVAHHALELEPGLVLRLPHLGGQRAAHGTRVLACGHQAGADARGVLRVDDHVLHDLARRDLAVALGVVAGELGDAQQALPALLGIVGGLRQQRGLVVDVEHARGVLGPLHVASHPEQVVCGSREHR